jgi:quercetin dioxygenase-like cupin family protein
MNSSCDLHPRLVAGSGAEEYIATASIQAVRPPGNGYCGAAHPEPAGPTRTILRKSDVSAPGREVIQALIEFRAGATSGKHPHPGEEVGYVLEGTVALTVDSQPPATLKAGDSFFVGAGRPHEVNNAEGATAKILAAYMVEKGKSLVKSVLPEESPR